MNRGGCGIWLLCWMLCLPMSMAEAGEGRQRTSINDGWRYTDGPRHDAALRDHDDAGWVAVSLPHTWNAHDAFDKETPYRRGEGWYRRTLDLPAAMRGKRLFVHFEGANQVAEVFINGHRLGQHVGGYTAFAFELTPHVRFDAGNVLAVRVDNRHDPDIPPLDADFTFFGGIYRNAWLIATDPVHLDVLDHAAPGIYVDTPRIDADEAVVRARGTVVNDSLDARNLQVVHRILDPDGREVADMRSSLRVDAGGRVPFSVESVPIRDLRLWSPRSPRLHTLVTTVEHDGRVLDRVDVRFGMRWFHFDPQRGFFLNGESHPLHGSNRHQDRAGFGNALSDAQHREDMQHVKDTGFNFVRLAHYPQATAVLDATDELGLAVWEEIPVVNLVTPSPEFATHAETMLVEMIRQHYNHPSIVMWGYMNEAMQFRPKPEPPGYEDWLIALTRGLEARTRQEDPFRVTATAISYTEIDNGSGFQDIPQVLGLNIYFGWYYHDLDTLGPWLDALHAKHPDRPIFISEYGADHDERVRARHPVAFDFSAEYQQRFHERSFEQLAERPWLAGTAVWNHFDFGSAGRQDSKFGINQKGLQFHDRSHKDVLYYYRAHMLQEPVLRIAAHEWTRRAGSSTEDALQSITVYSNADEVELLHDGRSLGIEPTRNALAQFDVHLRQGLNRLEAVARYRDDVVRDEVEIRYEDRSMFFSDIASAIDGIAINAGGSYDVIDAGGLVWEAGRTYRAGSWGSVGGRRVLSHHRIFGTELDPLWQDTLAGVEEYRFDVPDGEYLLEVGFVEVEHDLAGRRVFDVMVNGGRWLEGIDLASSQGRYRPAVHETRVQAVGGKGVALRFSARVGESTLSTVRLRRI